MKPRNAHSALPGATSKHSRAFISPKSKISLALLHCLGRTTATLGMASALVLMGPATSYAQETTSSIRGKIIGANGNVLSNAPVVVEDTRTGTKRTYTTNDSGTFFAARLSVGGPYLVSVAGRKVTVDSIALGESYTLLVDMSSIEEVVVTGQQLDTYEVGSGPSASFGAYELTTAVAINRDISDVYASDPRLNLDVDDDSAAINCAGKHPRFNSITLDGVSQNDRFGLNENGYSTAVGMPFPYDGIAQVSVSLAPFDATFGGFSACNINAVTKSGSNEWNGNAFYEWSSEDLKGESLGNDAGDLSNPAYNEKRMGFSIGGPLIEDKLFFFAAYEESDEPRFLSRGFAGSGNGVERDFLSEADFNRIVDIAQNVYGYDPGGQPSNGVQEDEKYMVRVDWNINDNHNAAFIYNYYDGMQSRDSDGDSNEFEFANHFYDKGSESETITVKVASQWTDALSTEVFYSTNEMNDSQKTVGPKDFGDFQISVGGRAGTVYLGADDSRQANALNTESEFFKISGQFLWENHVFSAGFETEELTIFNQFVQHSRGGELDFFDDSTSNPASCDALTAQQRFDDPACELSGIDRFELGRPSRVYYGSGGGTNNAADAAANFSNTLNSLYIQDEVFFDQYNLTLTAGLRYEYFDSDDRPTFNQSFTDSNNGLRNDSNIDGLDIIMPRIGAKWDIRDDLTLRGGIGLYSGGNPNVWISNAWSNDGFTNVQLRNNYFDCCTLLPGFADSVALSGQGRPGFDVPQDLVDAVAAVTATDASDENLVILDPNYEQPSEWKYAIGGTWDLPWGGVIAEFDYMHTRTKDAAIYVDLAQTITGRSTTGLPIYEATNGDSNYMLTNTSQTSTGDSVALSLRKSFDFGLDLMFGYAFTDAEDVAPMTASTAGSNFDQVATLDPNNLTVGTSNYVVPHRFTMKASYATELFEGLESRITLFGFTKQGQPQSYVMGSDGLEDGQFNGRHLLYVPTGLDDPNVVFGPDFDTTAFYDFVEREDLGVGFQARNAHHASWTTRFDLRLDQELPTFAEGTYAKFFFKIYNLGNLLNDEWGHVNDAQFFTIQQVESSLDAQGRFVFEEFNNQQLNDLQENASLWEVRAGLEFSF